MAKRTQLRKRFETLATADVPHGRNGKHKSLITEILDDLAVLKPGSALKIPLKNLTDSKENVRSALNRATRKANMPVATAADADYLYVWNKTQDQ
jgi:hypothetical protein